MWSTLYCRTRNVKMKKTDASRQMQVVHQIVSLTGINFTTRSIIGFVELTILPLKVILNYLSWTLFSEIKSASFDYFHWKLNLLSFQENLKYIRLNAKQCRIYKVVINGKNEASFQYFDPTLDVVQGVSHNYDVETYSDVHVKGNLSSV